MNKVKMEPAALVYTTFPTIEAAEEVGRFLVEAGLAACANIVPGMISIYKWKDRIQRDGEVMMLVKTRRTLAAQVVEEITARHGYDIPAVLTIEPSGGSDQFLAWIICETQRGGGEAT
jgi:periplasmic divalent cation tolerance protein